MSNLFEKYAKSGNAKGGWAFEVFANQEYLHQQARIAKLREALERCNEWFSVFPSGSDAFDTNTAKDMYEITRAALKEDE